MMHTRAGRTRLRVGQAQVCPIRIGREEHPALAAAEQLVPRAGACESRHGEAHAAAAKRTVPATERAAGGMHVAEPTSGTWCRCAGGEPSLGADVQGVSPVLVQMHGCGT
jgi:hypothetical protein